MSLHRSEGYGLTMAEAMALGKPVIATAYSGNTDFMTPHNSYLVEWEPTEVGAEAEHYPADAVWAEPSLDHAVELLREVHADREGAAARGARAASDIAALLSPDAVGHIARERLVRIASRRTGSPIDHGGLLADPDLAARLHFDLDGRQGSRGGARGALRRGLFRAIKPYTASERALDLALAESVRRMAVQLDAERAAAARERRRSAQRDARVAELEARLDEVLRRLADEG